MVAGRGFTTFSGSLPPPTGKVLSRKFPLAPTLGKRIDSAHESPTAPGTDPSPPHRLPHRRQHVSGVASELPTPRRPLLLWCARRKGLALMGHTPRRLAHHLPRSRHYFRKYRMARRAHPHRHRARLRCHLFHRESPHAAGPRHASRRLARRSHRLPRHHQWHRLGHEPHVSEEHYRHRPVTLDRTRRQPDPIMGFPQKHGCRKSCLHHHLPLGTLRASSPGTLGTATARQISLASRTTRPY